jgi:hypothetical protein
LQERFQLTWAGCLGGAILEESYWQIMGKVGFSEIQIVSRHTLTPKELKAMARCPGEEFTPPPNNEDLQIVQGKVDSVWNMLVLKMFATCHDQFFNCIIVQVMYIAPMMPHNS